MMIKQRKQQNSYYMRMQTRIPNIYHHRQDTIYLVVYEMKAEYFWHTKTYMIKHN